MRQEPAKPVEAVAQPGSMPGLPEGAPLVVAGRRVQAALEQRVAMPVELAMRYQNPSILTAVEKLRAGDVDDLLLIPLFPHYAMSSYETAVVRVKEVVAESAPGMKLRVQPPYYAADDYINALVASATHFRMAGATAKADGLPLWLTLIFQSYPLHHQSRAEQEATRVPEGGLARWLALVQKGYCPPRQARGRVTLN